KETAIARKPFTCGRAGKTRNVLTQNRMNRIQSTFRFRPSKRGVSSRTNLQSLFFQQTKILPRCEEEQPQFPRRDSLMAGQISTTPLSHRRSRPLFCRSVPQATEEESQRISSNPATEQRKTNSSFLPRWGLVEQDLSSAAGQKLPRTCPHRHASNIYWRSVT